MKCPVPMRIQSLLAIGLIVASCTIIEDDDVTSTAELDKLLESLTLQSFDIRQESLQGDGTISVSKKYDSVVNITQAATGVKLVRKIEFTLPPFGNLKMKLRSGSTGSTRLQAFFTDKKQLYNVRIIDRDSLVEVYGFRYTTAGKLARIVTYINPYGDGMIHTVFTEDTVIYRTDKPTFVDRIERKGGSSAVIDAQYSITTNGNITYEKLTRVIPPGNTNGGGSFENCGSGPDPTHCLNIDTGGLNLTCEISAPDGLTIHYFIADRRMFMSGGQNIRGFDTFYFHPTLIFTNEFENGFYLSVIYSGDWIKKATTTSPSNSFTEDEAINIDFTYAL